MDATLTTYLIHSVTTLEAMLGLLMRYGCMSGTFLQHNILQTSIVFCSQEASKHPFLQNFEVEALIAQAVQIKDLTPEQTMRIQLKKVPNPRAIHICTIFQRTCSQVDILNSACGCPITGLEVGPRFHLKNNF